MRRRVVITVCSTLLLLSWNCCLAETQTAGMVKAVKGRAMIYREGQTLEAREGMKILMGDRIHTADSAGIGLIFDDDSIVSMGPRSEMFVDDYRFIPVEGKLAFIVRFVRGTVTYLSGQIARLSPQSVRLETPVATIGVRGTQVLIKLE